MTDSASLELQQLARNVLEAEARAISSAAQRLDKRLVEAAELILRHKGKVVVSGMGKSGLIGQKIAATLSSTGTPAVFLHPAEALHGDLGIYQKGDPTILLSKSGSTLELLHLLPLLRQFKSPVIAIVGQMESPLAEKADVVLDGTVQCEADPLNLAPTTSTTLSLAIGDALACVLMQARNFKPEDFARFHPGGQLGRNLLLRVADIMHRKEEVATISPETPLHEVVIAITKYAHGAACVVQDGKLVGIITDGDLRRALQSGEGIRGMRADALMTKNPICVRADIMLAEALHIMEDRPSQISVLPVVDAQGRLEGLLRLHDAYQGPRT